MADYFPLLSKAVAALDPNTDDARQAIYERARSALLRQFASMSPMVEQAVVDRELKSLDDVCRRIEDGYRVQSAKSEIEATQVAEPVPVEVRDLPPPASQESPARIERPKLEAPTVKKSASARKPMIVMLLVLGLMAVVATAVIAILRRDIPASVADRSAPIAVAPPPTSQKAPDRIGETGTDRVAPAPGEVARTPPPPAAPAAPPAPAPVVATPQPAPVPPASTPPPSPAPAAAAPPAIGVANRAVLLLQGEGQDPRTSIVSRQGQVVWRMEPVAGQPNEIALRADIDFAQSRVQVEMSIQRNRDASLPASHLVQLRFVPGANAELGTVQSIATLEFRQVENQPGYQLAGQGIPVVANLFLIALSQVEQTRQLNEQMMRTRPLIYTEFVLADGKRGAILFEKGVSGEQLFAEAFRRW
jgi:hypothetical protein